MTTTIPGETLEDLRHQLEPVRTALLDEARTRAAQLIERAHADANRIAADAVTAADNDVNRAEQRARAGVRARADQRLDRARVDAHERILQTRTVINSRLRDAVRRAVLELRHDARYPDLLDYLEHLALTQLGPDAEMDRDPRGKGGLIAHRGGRCVDYTLTALADRALGRLGDDIERLWT